MSSNTAQTTSPGYASRFRVKRTLLVLSTEVFTKPEATALFSALSSIDVISKVNSVEASMVVVVTNTSSVA